jgi:hypothetical protein
VYLPEYVDHLATPFARDHGCIARLQQLASRRDISIICDPHDNNHIFRRRNRAVRWRTVTA